jgi:hypothetical protein
MSQPFSLHCNKKFIHAAGDHHGSRQNIRPYRTDTIKCGSNPDPDPQPCVGYTPIPKYYLPRFLSVCEPLPNLGELPHEGNLLSKCHCIYVAEDQLLYVIIFVINTIIN